MQHKQSLSFVICSGETFYETGCHSFCFTIQLYQHAGQMTKVNCPKKTTNF